MVKADEPSGAKAAASEISAVPSKKPSTAPRTGAIQRWLRGLGVVRSMLFCTSVSYTHLFSLSWLPYALVTGLLFLAGLTMINVSTGFRFANLDWEDPRRMTTSGGGWASLVLTLVYGVPATLVALLPFSAAQLWPQWSLPLMLVGVLALGLLTWLLMVFMARWAERSWELLPA